LPYPGTVLGMKTALLLAALIATPAHAEVASFYGNESGRRQFFHGVLTALFAFAADPAFHRQSF
jgi:hypothetical protein